MFMGSPLCGRVVGYDANGRAIGCKKPRCEEAGRRRLCLEHWQELKAPPPPFELITEPEAKPRTSKSKRKSYPTIRNDERQLVFPWLEPSE